MSCGGQGKVIQGQDGVIESGVIKVKCSKPSKTYTKDLDLKVDAEMDALKTIPKSKIDVEVKKSVVKLTQYTSEGLDRDLMLFRICEMANNRGLSQEKTSELIDKAMGTFDDEVKKKNRP